MQLTALQRRCAVAGRRQAGGFSMIELLVAVLVMGIGVLGVTALQMVSLQNNRGALQRAEAVQLAYDMMDRVRANPAGAPPGAAYSGLDLAEGPPNAPNCNNQNCTQAQMVAFDQAIWKCSLGNYHAQNICQTLRAAGVIADEDNQPGLTTGDGSINVDGNGVINVTVQWTELSTQQVRTITINSQS
jgi:type IV pilus assembly protein PilV